MANEIAEVLIPDPMTAVTGITRVSPTAQVEELTLPIVAVMFWARRPGAKPRSAIAKAKKSVLTLKLDVFMVAGRLFCIRCGNILF
jgi:hypothetical protein